MEYRANLSAAIYPMTLSDAGRTVINPQADQNFDRRVDPAGEQKDAGIPQALYLENVMPTINGYQSFGYVAKPDLPANGGTQVLVKAVRKIGDYIVLFREGLSSFRDVISNSADLSKSWAITTGTIPNIIGNEDKVFVAEIVGLTYVFIPGQLYSVAFDALTAKATFTSVTLTGAPPLGTIKSICSSYNYLILLEDTGRVYWSSTTTPTNFTASLVTGAGSEVPNGVKGTPQFMLESPEGFYIYYSDSVIFAKYTGNSRYPWKFFPVSDSGGYSNLSNVAGGITSNIQYTIDKSRKIQLISGAESKVVAPELSSYLERKRYRDVYTPETSTFSKAVFSALESDYKIFYVEDRYLIAYVAYTWIIYDTLLQRYGKLFVRASYVYGVAGKLYFIPGDISTNITPYEGTFDLYNEDAEYPCYAMFGKFQYIRDRFIELNSIDIESDRDEDFYPDLPDNITVKIFPTLDGNNFTAAKTLTTTSEKDLVTANCRVTGKNISVMLEGAFMVNTIVLDFQLGGGR